MATFETIKLDKGLYRSGLGINAELEKLDPSENYKGTALENLDAFERQLKRFDIKIKGADSSPIEKFFQTSDSAALFPEFISRSVKQGISEANNLDAVIGAHTEINGLDYRTIGMASEEELDSESLAYINEGALIPETAIETKENLVKLHKRGRMLTASYEAIRFQRLDVFSVALRQIGNYIARAQLADAITVLISGDGNDNPAKVITRDSEGNITYADLVKLWNSLGSHTMNTLISDPTVAAQIITLPEMKDAAAGLNFHATGKAITPLGANLVKFKDFSGGLIALDKNRALEMVTAGGVVTDFDKLIDRQLHRAAITQTAGFAKIFDDASVVMEF